MLVSIIIPSLLSHPSLQIFSQTWPRGKPKTERQRVAIAVSFLMREKEPQSSGGREAREGGLGCRSAFLPAATGDQELSSQWKDKFRSVPGML